MYQKIMVPLDGSELAECVLPHVETIARGSETKNVIFVRVLEPLYVPAGESADWSGITKAQTDTENKIEAERRTEAENYLDRLVNRLDCGSARTQTELLTGKAAESLADYAVKNEVDLIIIATHGHSGISRWVRGNVADRILHSSCAPVLMVRAPGCLPRT
ncbi:universal stress protein [Chloroflexota bacterium]